MSSRTILFAVVLLSVFSIAASYTIDQSKVTVGGLSAGGFVAVQLHVAFSSQFKGAAVYAGGPYYCAQNSENIGLTACMSSPTLLNVNTLVTATKKFEQSGAIDPLTNLNGQPVYVYSGTDDTVVHSQVVHDLVTYYQTIANVSILSEFSIVSEHCLPTLNYGEVCKRLSSPYIGNCAYDGAGMALTQLYGNLSTPAANFIQANIHEQTNQLSFVPKGTPTEKLGLANNYFVYVPSACQANNVVCKLHLELHGCNQNYLDVSDAYYAHGGFNTWAETNNIIVVYPQAKAFTSLTPGKSNPEGCFDWWGYTNANYASKTGLQMQTFMNIISYLSTPSTVLKAN